jgi:chemotaxis family two-component system sensor kinase Cph1
MLKIDVSLTIYLLGKAHKTLEKKTKSIQSFGNLIMLNSEYHIVGISEQVSEFYYKRPISSLDHVPSEEVLKDIFGSFYPELKEILVDVRNHARPRQLLTKKLDKHYYYIKISNIGENIYLEWELQLTKQIAPSHLNEVGFLFEKHNHSNWQLVSKAIQKMIGLERVCILRIFDNGYSKVLAESTEDKNFSILQMEFSNQFMPHEIVNFYTSLPYRYLEDVQATPQPFHSFSPLCSISDSQLSYPPTIHLLHQKEMGVRTAIFFPLVLNGHFWGLVIGQDREAKRIDLQNRKICTFVVQNAMSRYENWVKQDQIDFNRQIQDFETTFLKDLNLQPSIHETLHKSAPTLCSLMHADGFAIYHDGDYITHEVNFSIDLFYELIRHLQKNNAKTLLKDHNFKASYQHLFSENLPFAGLLAYQIGDNQDHYLLWFRKAHTSMVMQMEKVKDSNEDITSLRTWERLVENAALPWNDNNLLFIDRLQKLINESILIGSKKTKQLTKKLTELNNELEMFTHTLSHDLKNPLSVLKMGLNFLFTSSDKLDKPKRKEWHLNLLNSVTHIEDIVDNIIDLSNTKTNQISKNLVPMHFMIRKVSEEISVLHHVPPTCIQFGQLHPVLGEKSTLYQIFLNVIGNAVKYSAHANPPQISVDSVIINEQVCYKISDNGIGIPEEFIPHVFEMFNRANNAVEFQGTGVGLSLVKRIMDRLDGSVKIHSSPGHGTIIELHFPHHLNGQSN